MATANFTLDLSRVFPNGTVVKAYPASNWVTTNPSGAPLGTATQEKTVASGKAEFTGLTVGTSYYAVAEVGGVYRYVTMNISAGKEVSGSRANTEAALKNLLTVLNEKGIISDTTTA